MSDKKVKKEVLQQKFENLVMVEGQDKNWIQIAETYQAYMEGGFDVSVEELAVFFSCHSLTIETYIRNYCKFIIVSTTGRKFIRRAINEGLIIIEEEQLRLINKRILFLRSDVESFIQNLQVEIKFGFLDWEDILSKVPTDRKEKRASLNLAAAALYGESEPEVGRLGKVPDKLYSLKDLKLMQGHKYNVDTYRWLNRIGANKIFFQGLVRYDLSDFDKAVAVPIQAFRSLGSNRVIQELREVMETTEE
ncbi:hypothetical protein ACFQZE_23875 [Paenibacillus sp. GCM10027627]|uniref:hypothetical protein n=1 Tax=unclassified Paenibacillus TaxID=185978 RepID=UPI00362B9B00